MARPLISFPPLWVQRFPRACSGRSPLTRTSPLCHDSPAPPIAAFYTLLRLATEAALPMAVSNFYSSMLKCNPSGSVLPSYLLSCLPLWCATDLSHDAARLVQHFGRCEEVVVQKDDQVRQRHEQAQAHQDTRPRRRAVCDWASEADQRHLS